LKLDVFFNATLEQRRRKTWNNVFLFSKASESLTLNIPDFTNLRVLVAGDVMLDEYRFGDTGRISPEAPVPVVRTQGTERRPGGAANVACNIAALGAHVQLAAVIGADDRGQVLSELLVAADVECHLIKAPYAPTIHKLRVLSRNQQLIRLDSEESFIDQGDIFAELVCNMLTDTDVVVLSDYGKGSLHRVKNIISACVEAKIPVLVDPKGTDFHRYEGATLLTPNQAEFAAVVGHWKSEDEFVTHGESLRKQLDLEALLITRGERGMTLFPKGDQPLSLPAEAREVFDVTGAGDTFISLMAVGVGCGLNFEAAAGLANLGAGLVVRKIGVASITVSELRIALHSKGTGGRGHVSVDELEAILKEARYRGERIVMTNGCFDILHAGHVSYLEEAKTYGDRLVIAVNDDDSVKGLKGETRPINPLEDRMAVLSGLAAVDWVVSFSEDTPAELISRLLPDVLVKGGDYQMGEIVGGKAVIENGGEVRVLSYKDGRSTSAVIDAIRKN